MEWIAWNGCYYKAIPINKYTHTGCLADGYEVKKTSNEKKRKHLYVCNVHILNIFILGKLFKNLKY